MTKERIVKELSKVREQLAGLQARERDLAEQLQMAEDAEKMKFIEKNKISLDRLILLNKVSEEEIQQESFTDIEFYTNVPFGGCYSRR